MKLIDKNGRLFGKISVIDVLVILAVLVLAAGLHAKTSKNAITATTGQNDVFITYSVEVEGVRSYVADAVREGDKLYEQDRSTGGSIGEILSIEKFPGTKSVPLWDGTYRKVPAEDCANLLLTVKGKGIVSDGHYLLNRVYELGVNSSRNYNTTYAQFVGKVHSIEKP